MAFAVDITGIRTVANIIKKDVFITPALIDHNELTRCGFKILTGIQNLETEYISLGVSGNTRKYDPAKGGKDRSRVALLMERPLKVNLSVYYAQENIQRFREVEPFDAASNLAPEAIVKGLPVTTHILRQMGVNYTTDLMSNVIFGDVQSEGQYSCYDGINKEIAKLKSEWTDSKGNKIPVVISEANGNLIKTDPLTKPTTTTDTDAYDAVVSFYEGLSPALKAAPEVYLLVGQKERNYVFQAYMNKYTQIQASVKFEDGFRFLDCPNLILVGSSMMGEGSQMIAYTKENLQYGMDEEATEANIFVAQCEDDGNVLNFQIQSPNGTRILDPTARAFAVNDKVNTPITLGEKMANTLNLFYNPEEISSVSRDKVSEDYEAGTVVTLTPTFAEGKKLKNWTLDGVSKTDATIKVTMDGPHRVEIFAQANG